MTRPPRKKPPFGRAALLAHGGIPSTEDPFHFQVCGLLRAGYPTGAGFWFHVPNEGKRSIAGHQKMIAMGMVQGMTDFVLVCAGRVAFLELKRPDGKGRLSKKQEDFRDLCKALGLPWTMAEDLEAAEAFIREFVESCGCAFRARLRGGMAVRVG
jgi:hypothetical protein